MIDQTLIHHFQQKYQENKANAASEHAIAEVGIQKASIDVNVKRNHPFVFSEETKRGKITNQKSSGRCWMFAALNTARVSTMEKLNLETFEFSQNYTLFWDKLEKSNFFLESIIDTVDEPLDSRLVWHLLQNPIEDGGQWEMFVGILKKYGSVPKSVMPETFHSSNTNMLNTILGNKLREYAAELRTAHEKGESKESLRERKDEQLYFVYNVLTKALGEVPETFDYAYRDKEDVYHRITNITPQDFFLQYSDLKINHMVSLINAPTADKPYNKTYTVNYLGSIYESEPIKYLNVTIEELKEAAITAIKAGHPVWFGCDVGKLSERQLGIMDPKIYAYTDTLGETLTLDKGQRLDYSMSLLTHAMVLVGVDLDEEGKPKNWKVENSWGDKVGDKGIFSMSDEWFDEFTYQVTVPSEYIQPKLRQLYKEDPIKLVPWDPMGSLAWLK